MDQLARLQAALGHRYAFERELGRGRNTIVYQARDLKHDRPVAIKVLDAETTAGIETARFLREIQIAAKLLHPHVLSLFDSGQVDEFLYYVMPLVTGESLRDRLTREVQLPLEDALRIAKQVGQALEHAHSHDVIHRDIKPGNILLMDGRHAMVADFGIARALNAASEDGVTTGGLTVGTPWYMSPEQCSGARDLDARSDVYALGCVLYEMLAGEPPFPGPNRRAVMARHVKEEAPSPKVLRPQTPDAVEAVVAKALAKLPADRYQSAQELCDALTGLPATRVPPTAPPARPPWTRAVLAVLAVPLAVWIGLAVSNRAEGPPEGARSLVVLPLEGQGSGDAAMLHRSMQVSLSFLPDLEVMDGTDLLRAGGGGWRSHDMDDLLQGAADKGGAYLLVGDLLDGDEGRTLAVTGYSVPYGERILHQDDGPVTTHLEESIDRLALAVARELAGVGVDVGVPAYLFRSTTSARALGHLLLGQEKFYRGDLGGARTAFRQAIEADSGFALGYHRLSTVEAWDFDYPAALSVTDRGIAHSASATREWQELLRAQRLLVTRQADSLVDLMERYVSDFPDNADGWFLLGSAEAAYPAVTGGCAADAIPRWERSLRIDGNLAPVHGDIIQWALQFGDEATARAHLDLVPGNAEIPRAAFDLQFGSPSVRAETLRRLAGAERNVLSELVKHLAYNGLDLPLADTLAWILMDAQRPREQQQRGAYYHVVASTAQGRLDEALPVWDRLRSDDVFDLVMVDAYLAGYPVDAYALPMFDEAQARVTAGSAPDYAEAEPWDESRGSFRALVQRAVMEGDSAQVDGLLEVLDRTSATADPSDPMPGNLRAALRGRLALLAADTSGAIEWFQRSVMHPVTHLNIYPLMSMALERLLLTELHAARGDYQRAGHWVGTFRSAGALTDVLYHRRLDPIKESIVSAGVSLETCGREPIPR